MSSWLVIHGFGLQVDCFDEQSEVWVIQVNCQKEEVEFDILENHLGTGTRCMDLYIETLEKLYFAIVSEYHYHKTGDSPGSRVEGECPSRSRSLRVNKTVSSPFDSSQYFLAAEGQFHGKPKAKNAILEQQLIPPSWEVDRELDLGVNRLS